MKKLLLAAVLFTAICTSTNAQTTSLTITNNTNCDVWIKLYGDPNGGGCNGSHESDGIRIPAMSTINYANPLALPMVNHSVIPTTSLGATDHFVFAELWDAEPASCLTNVVGYVGEACSPHPSSSPVYNVKDNTCSPCGSVTATWSGGILTFN